MKSISIPLSLIVLVCFFTACERIPKEEPNKLKGSWQLLSSVYIKKDTVIHNDLPGTSMIKILNDTHFAFMQHTVDKADSTGIFGGGGGTYTLKGNQYTEHVEYCSSRGYEGNDFEFTVEFHGDTLVQSGIEKLKEIGAGEEDMQLVEKYLRIPSPANP
jgi:hypothetical protein